MTVFSSNDYCELGNTAAAVRCPERGAFNFFYFPPLKAVNPEEAAPDPTPVQEALADGQAASDTSV
jgi:hypothetical protein